MFAEAEAKLLLAGASSPAELDQLVERRLLGQPLEHVLGWAEFSGLRIAVQPGVFVPRRRTEWLVMQAAAVTTPGAVLVDLCCGSGAVGAALASASRPRSVHAVDIDPRSVQCARLNLEPFGGVVHQGDLYDALPADLRGRVDVVVANAPYVPTGSLGLMPPEARLHEPRTALDGGGDGLDIQRRVVAEATDWLAPGGQLIVETSRQQASSTAELFSRAGLLPTVSRSTRLDATVVSGHAVSGHVVSGGGAV